MAKDFTVDEEGRIEYPTAPLYKMMAEADADKQIIDLSNTSCLPTDTIKLLDKIVAKDISNLIVKENRIVSEWLASERKPGTFKNDDELQAISLEIELCKKLKKALLDIQPCRKYPEREK